MSNIVCLIDVPNRNFMIVDGTRALAAFNAHKPTKCYVDTPDGRMLNPTDDIGGRWKWFCSECLDALFGEDRKRFKSIIKMIEVDIINNIEADVAKG